MENKSNNTFLQLININKSFSVKKNKVEAIKDVSFSLKEREIVSIIGPSGCGKTTLLNLIAGFDSPTNGDVSFVDQNIKKKIGFIFQTPSLLSWRNVAGNIMLPLEIGKNKIQKDKRLGRVEEMIRLVNLKKFSDFYPYQLSAGMQQRVSLARALITRPQLMLMDEPFSALDAIMREVLCEEIINIHENLDTSILFVTHSIDEAILISHRIIILSDRPSSVKEEIKVEIPYPRNTKLRSHKTYLPLFGRIKKLLKNE